MVPTNQRYRCRRGDRVTDLSRNHDRLLKSIEAAAGRGAARSASTVASSSLAFVSRGSKVGCGSGIAAAPGARWAHHRGSTAAPSRGRSQRDRPAEGDLALGVAGRPVRKPPRLALAGGVRRFGALRRLDRRDRHRRHPGDQRAGRILSRVPGREGHLGVAIDDCSSRPRATRRSRASRAGRRGRPRRHPSAGGWGCHCRGRPPGRGARSDHQ